MLLNIAAIIQSPYFKGLFKLRCERTPFGWSLKERVAISGGFWKGLGYGYNTRAAMITRGIAEMLRFGKVLNARPETFYGLSGMGDLILTTTGDLSRNKTLVS